jgi:hypothetical protein
MILLLLCLTSLSRKQLGDHPIVLDGASDRYASGFVFVTSQFGIYTFNRDAQTWGRITQATGLPDNQVDALGLDEGILWVATPHGLSSADIRINDWKTYGLPGRTAGLTFDAQYVWAGGEFGVKRFDKFAETWEDVAAPKVNDLYSEKDYVWFATDSGVLRYDRSFDKLEAVPAPHYLYSLIINTPRRLWFIARDHFVACEKKDGKWSTYDGFAVCDFTALGDSLFVVGSDRVRLFEPNADNWVPFRGIEDLHDVNGIFAAGPNLLFATARGLLVYDRSEKSTRTYRRASGLETDSLVAVHADDRFIFAVSRRDIEFLDRQTGIWKAEPMMAAPKRQPKILFLDDAGAHLAPFRDTDLRLSGRAYYSDSRTVSGGRVTPTGYENIALNLTGQHRSGRSLSLYYDDTDRERLLYGFGYRGAERDLLYRCDGGYVRSEYADFDLIPRFSLLGAGAKLRDRALSVGLQGGRLQSRLRNEFFTGRSQEKHVKLRDLDYSKGIFYASYSPTHSITRGFDTVLVDDRRSATNRVDTRLGFTIAGSTGDFDPLINGLDYFIDYDRGLIRFVASRSRSDIIALKLNGAELIIQSDSVTGLRLENVYAVAPDVVPGPDIIPGSFSLVITDTLGHIHPLAEFGLDPDHDGRVDPEFLNYDQGFLSFPAPRTFPGIVYQDTVNVFTMDINFRSQSSFYYLSYRPIERNSERILVDGELLTPAADYVVDYTSGVLLLLRPDIVSDFSEIAVQYSAIERANKTLLYSVQPDLNPAPGVNLAPAISVVEDETLYHFSGKAEAQLGDKGNVRFVPQVALGNGLSSAQAYSLTANYRKLSARAEYRNYSADFNSFGAAERTYGTLRQGGLIAAGVEPLAQFRLDGQFRREQQADSTGRVNVAQYLQGKASYLNPKLPNGYVLIGGDRLPDITKQRLKLSGGYELQARKTKVKLNAVVHGVLAEHVAGNRDTSVEFIADVGFNLPVPIHGNLHYRRNQLSGSTSSPRGEEELRGRLNLDVIPGLFYAGSYNLQTTSYTYVPHAQSPSESSKDLLIEGRFYHDLQIAPGRWLPALSIINLSVGAGNSFDQYARNLTLDYRPPRLVIRPVENVAQPHTDELRNYYGTVQLNPWAELMLRAKHTQSLNGADDYRLPELKPTVEDELRVEYGPKNWGSFTALWDRRNLQSYPVETINNTYLEWNKPWSEALRTKFTTTLRLDQENYGTIATAGSELKAVLSALFRFNARSFITLSLGGDRQASYASRTTYSVIPGAGLNLNFFRFLYIQIDCQSTLPFSGASSHLISTRLTGQF